jgi:hypothetical protein
VKIRARSSGILELHVVHSPREVHDVVSVKHDSEMHLDSPVVSAVVGSCPKFSSIHHSDYSIIPGRSRSRGLARGMCGNV